MASQRRSKIPRYVKSSNPVSSLEYRKTLKLVREKKIEISRKECELKVLKSSTLGRENLENVRELEQEEEQEEEQIEYLSLPVYSGTIRSTIVTPGGTKRKGSYIILH